MSLKQFLIRHWLTILLASLLILFVIQINSLLPLPGNINPDEADNLRTYLMYKEGVIPFFGFNWNGAPLINTIIIGFIWERLGQSLLALRMAAIIFSFISILLFYFIASYITKNKVLSFLYSILLIANPWYFNFTRSAWENIFNAIPVLLLVLALYLLFKKRNVGIALVLSIVASIMGFYFYHPGKLFFPVATFLFFVYSVTKSRESKDFLYTVLKIVAVIFFILPQLISLLTQRDMALNRIDAVSVFTRPDTLALIIHNFSINVVGFLSFNTQFFVSRINMRYFPDVGYLIQPFVVVFYIVGLIYSVRRYPYLVIFYLLLLMPVEVLSVDSPDAARVVHLVPLIFLFSLLGLNYVLYWIKETVPKTRYFNALLLACIVIILFCSFVDVYTYKTWIRSAIALNARQPAVSNQEYHQWLATLSSDIHKNKTGFDVSQWDSEVNKGKIKN